MHITKADASTKFDVLPEINLVKNNGFKNAELKMIKSIIEENKEVIIERWNEYFRK